MSDMIDYGKLSPEARELILFAENDEPTYRHEQAIYKNLDKKMQKGIFDRQKAAKLFTHETDAAAKRYAKEYGESYWGGQGVRRSTFSKPVREEAARFLANAYERSYPGRLQSGEAFLMKKYSKVKRSR